MPLDKPALRRQLLKARRETAPEKRRAMDDGIFRRLTALEAYQRAGTVFLYCSTEEEVSTARLLEDALRTGKRVCVPLCTGTRGVMEAREITEPSELVPGRYGIPEPPAWSPAVPPEEIDLCVVPCLAADASGHRLGYGGGYYDRFLARTAAETVVLCPESRFTVTLPAEPHDRSCNIVVTERRVHIAH